MKSPITFTATITGGTITVTAKSPEDFERARETIMEIMTAIAGDNAIAYTDCLDPEDADAIARRLAKMIMGEAA
jgi:hypothetical protein